MSMTKKIQFYFPDDLLFEINTEAEKRNISMAKLVRTAVEMYLDETRKSKATEKDPLDKMAGFFEGDKDLSEKHDFYLYGYKKK